MNRLSLESIVIEKSDKDIPVGIMRNFTDGINLICGDNEAGKSSMLAFIRGGFFKIKGVDKGKIYFKIGQKHYRTDIQDNRTVDLRCRVFDENNNPVSYDFIENTINKKYFEQGFTINLDDLMSIQNKDTDFLVNVIKDPSGEKLSEIIDKLKNDTKKILGDNNRLTKDITKITEDIKRENIKINELSNLENRYNSVIRELEEINKEIETVQKKEELLIIRENLKNLNEQLNEMLNKKNAALLNFNENLFNNQEDFIKIIQQTGNINVNNNVLEKNSIQMQRLNDKISAELNRLQSEFSINIKKEDVENFNIDYSVLNRVKELLNRKSEAEKELIAAKQNKLNIEEALLKLKHEAESLNQKKSLEEIHKKLKIAAVILMLMSILICVFCFYNKLPAAGVLSCIITLILGFGFSKIPAYNYINDITAKNIEDTSYNSDKLQNAENKTAQIQTVIDSSEKEAQNIIKSVNNNVVIPYSVYIQVVDIIKNIKENILKLSELSLDITKLKEENSKIIDNFNSFIKRMNIQLNFSENFLENIQYLKSFNEKNTEVKNNINTLNIHIENITKQITKLEEQKNSIGNIIEEGILKEEIINLKQEKLSQKKTLEYEKHDLEKFEGLEDIKIKKAVLLEEYRKKMFILAKNKMVIEIVNRAKERFDSVQPDLKSARKYLEILTEGKYSKINLELMEIQSKDGSVTKKWSELSRGTQEQLYFALRLGYASNYTIDKSTMQPNGKVNLPLIIDDAFVNFDTKRTKAAIKCLIEFSKTNQILFFTCHKDIMQKYFEDLCSEGQTSIITL